jgi:Retroviral aspartyl protease
MDYRLAGPGDSYPVPSTELEVAALDGEFFPLPAFVDTGAERTTIPASSLPLATVYTTEWVRIASGQRVKLNMYLLNTRLGRRLFRQHLVYTWPLPHAVIGRDILNKFKVLLEGPVQHWDMDPQEGSWDMER